MNITIKELPDFEVAFVRHVGSYAETGGAWDQLSQWAVKNGLFPPQQSFIGISLDDPATVEAHACRYDACVTVPPGFDRESHPEVKFQTLDGGLYALCQFYDTADQLGGVFQMMFGQWLPASEYVADARPCLEFCMNNPADDPEGKVKVDLYIPVQKKALT
ncbi:GyrI-like domain-containing protein [Tumebacillus sp. ITR2]|uniref:GyrI-like domain-containing protein n=1 Tax=Tumebacillus amylolyticus TaxID=2801339 RepID=A0ABS1JBX4_9BACL|nr:GyrI-like domain-containing protein [Tumebacillus amylolyticus]MBL0387775.1 GyrI-like domain-containing protein [Tumebacillus amylolyticus]